MTTEEIARTTRTPSITTIEQLAAHIAEVRDLAAAVQGKDVSIDVQVQTPATRYMHSPGSVEEHRDHLGRLEDAGVTSFVLQPPGGSVEETVEALQSYGETFGLS